MTRINWRCRFPGCGVTGWDPPGLASFWFHFAAWHLPRSIYYGTEL